MTVIVVENETEMIDGVVIMIERTDEIVTHPPKATRCTCTAWG